MAIADASRVRPLPAQPARSAMRSRTIQPTLWRVLAYWSPGLPRPTTIFTRSPVGASPGEAVDVPVTPNGPDPAPGGPGGILAVGPRRTVARPTGRAVRGRGNARSTGETAVGHARIDPAWTQGSAQRGGGAGGRGSRCACRSRPT